MLSIRTLWGVGGLTFGLAIRYLGVSLGMAVALGFTTAFGTLVPPLFDGTFAERLSSHPAAHRIGGDRGNAGGHCSGGGRRPRAGIVSRRRGQREPASRAGVLVAVFSGIMSSCFAYGLAAGAPIRAASLAAGTGQLWQGLPVLCVVLAGGFTTNAIWCGWLITRNRSAGQWARPEGRARNLALCAAGGLLWYFQFFFYTMGESQMGRYGFSSWTLHMGSIIIFSTLWGFALAEWRGSSRGTRGLVWAGIGLLVGATVIIGWGNSLGGDRVGSKASHLQQIPRLLLQVYKQPPIHQQCRPRAIAGKRLGGEEQQRVPQYPPAAPAVQVARGQTWRGASPDRPDPGG